MRFVSPKYNEESNNMEGKRLVTAKVFSAFNRTAPVVADVLSDKKRAIQISPYHFLSQKSVYNPIT